MSARTLTRSNLAASSSIVIIISRLSFLLSCPATEPPAAERIADVVNTVDLLRPYRSRRKQKQSINKNEASALDAKLAAFDVNRVASYTKNALRFCKIPLCLRRGVKNAF